MSASPGWSLVPTRPVVRTCERRARRRSLGGRAAPWLASGSLPPKSRASALRGSCRGGGAGFYLPARRGPRTIQYRRAVASRIHCRVRAGPCCRGGTLSAHAAFLFLAYVRAPVGRDVRDGPARSCPRRVHWPNRWNLARRSYQYEFFFKYCCARWPDVKASTTPAAGLKLNRNCSFIYASECHGHMARESRLGC